MIPTRSSAVGRQLEVLWTAGTFTGLSDAHLLSRFIGSRDRTAEAAFRELVDRHGPMVMGVCRQILRRPQDADDAFQATFLVLVRKARSIRVGDSLAPWLYGVAYRTAHRVRAIAGRYRTDAIEPMAEAVESSRDDSFTLDVRPLLHEELARLPGKYRDPIVLCHLEGKTHEEAARLLAWPVGTVSGRLSRGRQLLKARLERRGVEAPSAILAARWLTEAPLSPSLVEAALGASARFSAAATISTSVQSLAQGILRAMLIHKLKLISLALVAVGVMSGGLAWAIRASRAASPPVPPEAGPAATAPSEQHATQPSRDHFAAPQPKPIAPDVDPVAVPGQAAGPGLGIRPAPFGENRPNAVDLGHRLPVFRSSSILVVESPDRRSWQAMSPESEDVAWQKLPIPAGVTATPLLTEDTVALALKGKSIDHVAAFSRSTGKWSVQHLSKPAEEVSPYINGGGAVYQIGNDVYAFSSRAGKWGELHLEGSGKPRVSLSANDIDVMQGNRLYVFSLKHGRFSAGVEVNTEMFRGEPPGARPAR
jgi:RNA polymerase sigma factor (sigma-70 family)